MRPPTEPGGNAHPDSTGAGVWSYWLATGAESPIDLGPGRADYAPMVWNDKSGEYRGYIAGPGRGYPSVLSDHVGRTQMVPHVGADPVLRWTSAVEGEVRVSGSWWLSPPGGGNVHLAIFADGKPLFEQRGYTSHHNPGAAYDLRIPVRPGTAIEWWSDANGDPSHDCPRLRALIDPGPDLAK